MSPAQHRLLALWAALLSAVLCLIYLPGPRLWSLLLLLALWGVIAALCYRAQRHLRETRAITWDNLPAASYRQPVVLVCGDLPEVSQSTVLTVNQGCWIYLPDVQQLALQVRQLLTLRPDWGRQLALLVTLSPQHHSDHDALTSRLLTLRWQLSQLHQTTGHKIPLILSGQVSSALSADVLWHSALPGSGIQVWHASQTPVAQSSWVSNGGATTSGQQILLNSLMHWFHDHVVTVFTSRQPDMPCVVPSALLWGLVPGEENTLPPSLWTAWLSRCTALHQVAGWQASAKGAAMPLPDFILPLLPPGRGLTPGLRCWRSALAMLTLTASMALLCSGWHNHALLQRLTFDLARYQRIAVTDYPAKAAAVARLQEDVALLDRWSRNGVPLKMGLGLYQGNRLYPPLQAAIHSYQPPPPPQQKPAAKIIRLDSMSLFDSGKADLKPGSTKMLINSLVGIKAKPGWLIVVSGHTDNTGTPPRNQLLSLKRAEAVRNWMRDTGDVPESCFAVQGYGDSRPIATNDTPAGRALNRRVEITLIPQADACQIVAPTAD